MSRFTSHNKVIKDFVAPGKYVNLKKRKISEEVCEFYEYSVGRHNGTPVHIAPYYEDTFLVAQKLRTKEKRFYWTGNATTMSLFGINKFATNPKLEITITEGEIDALSVAQMMSTRYPVVSVQHGVAGAYATIKHNLNYLRQFKGVVICFDNEPEAQEIAAKCATLFPHNFVRILKLPLKDPNEMLVAGRADEFKSLWFNAPQYSARNFLIAKNINVDDLFTADPITYSLPFPLLNKAVRGLKPGRLYTIAAGPGLGKTTFVKELVHHLYTKHNLSIGCLFLEEMIHESVLSFYAMDKNLDIEVLLDDVNSVNKKDLESYLKTQVDNKLVFFNFNDDDIKANKIIQDIEYLMVGLDCSVVVLDHITMATYAEGSGGREDIDDLVAKLRLLCRRTGKTIITIVHLIKPPADGLDYSEGRTVTLKDIRGSSSIAQLSDFILALERNQLSDDKTEARTTHLKILKSRRGGVVGYIDSLRYDSTTRRLVACGTKYIGG